MTPVLFVLAAACGALGRHLVARFTCSWRALLIVNTAGAALLGWLVEQDLEPDTLVVLGVGLCGAFTTYSSFALEAQALGWRWGGVYAASTVVCVTGAASLGASF
jgi:CrcB protein